MNTVSAHQDLHFQSPYLPRYQSTLDFHYGRVGGQAGVLPGGTLSMRVFFPGTYAREYVEGLTSTLQPNRADALSPQNLAP